MNTGSVSAHRMALNSNMKLLIIRTSWLIRGRCCFSLELIYHDVKLVLSASFIFCYMNIMQTKREAGRHSSFRCCHRLKHRGGFDRHTRKVNFSKRKCVCASVCERERRREIKEYASVFWCYCHIEESPTLCMTLCMNPELTTHTHKTHTHTHLCPLSANGHTSSSTHLLPAAHFSG